MHSQEICPLHDAGGSTQCLPGIIMVFVLTHACPLWHCVQDPTSPHSLTAMQPPQQPLTTIGVFPGGQTGGNDLQIACA